MLGSICLKNYLSSYAIQFQKVGPCEIIIEVEVEIMTEFELRTLIQVASIVLINLCIRKEGFLVIIAEHLS